MGVLHEGRQAIDALVLVGLGLAPPAVVLVERHVEQAPGDDLVLVADVACVIGGLEARGLVVTRVPGAAELLPGARLEAAGGGDMTSILEGLLR